MGQDVKKNINDIAQKLAYNYKEQGLFEIGIGEKLPKRKEIIEIVREIKRLMFPGYFGTENTAYVSLESFAGNTLATIYEKMFKQVKIAFSYKAENKNIDRKSVV